MRPVSRQSARCSLSIETEGLSTRRRSVETNSPRRASIAAPKAWRSRVVAFMKGSLARRVAAGLDRIDRADGAANTRSDPRYLQLEQAIRVLTDGKPDRTERVQMVFSLPYEERWASLLGITPRGDTA